MTVPRCSAGPDSGHDSAYVIGLLTFDVGGVAKFVHDDGNLATMLYSQYVIQQRRFA